MNSRDKVYALASAKRRLGQWNLKRRQVVAIVAQRMFVRVPTDKTAQYELLARFNTSTPAPPRKQRQPLNEVSTDAFLLSYEWRRLRMVVIKKRGARCECCGASPKDGVTIINVDHVKSRRDYPELALVESNLQVLCSPCNHGKGNWDSTDWREMTDEQACRILEASARGTYPQH
jgi:hypothetical protein